MRNPASSNPEHVKLDNLYCGRCGNLALRKKGRLISFRKNQRSKASDVVIETAESSPFMFTCNECGTRQLPMITLRLAKEKGGPTHVSIAGQ